MINWKRTEGSDGTFPRIPNPICEKKNKTDYWGCRNFVVHNPATILPSSYNNTDKIRKKIVKIRSMQRLVRSASYNTFGRKEN